jgi:hypothetical protein
MKKCKLCPKEALKNSEYCNHCYNAIFIDQACDEE